MSRRTRIAVGFASITLTCVCIPASVVRAEAVATPTVAAAPFAAIDQTWHDAARSRDLPVRIYLPRDASKAVPAIIVSHGLGDSRYAIAYACEAWAARGYVVITVQHPGSDREVWNRAAPAGRFAELAKAANVENFVLRCGDVTFALDEVARRTAAEGGPLSGRVDIDRLGVAGHSFGALTAQGIIGERFAPQGNFPVTYADPRVKACVLMSPGLEGAADLKTAFATVTVPVFSFTGTVDVVPGLGITLASRRRIPFDRMTASDQYLVTFDRGDHMVFSGHRPAGIDNARYDRIQSWTARLSADFWDLYLKGDPTAAATLATNAASLGDVGRYEQKPATESARAKPVEAGGQ